MNGWILALTLIAGGLALTAVIVYAAERDLRRQQERFRESMEQWKRAQDR